MPHDPVDWNERYDTGNTPWDSGCPSHELLKVVQEYGVKPTKALELGCGTGTNAIWLARHGCDVTATDVSTSAIAKAKAKAAEAGVKITFIHADLLANPNLGGPYPFVFDRGVYHHCREIDLKAFQRMISKVTMPGSLYLSLAGNADEPNKTEHGPPRVHAREICDELLPLFYLQQLREFRLDGVVVQGQPMLPWGWSILLRRREAAS